MFGLKTCGILDTDSTFSLELLFLGTSKFMVKRVKVEKAKSDKSSCKKCQKKIGFDELRAGVDCWMAGRTMTAWLHMKCMSQCFKFDRCKGRGKCKMSGDTMERGEARLELAREYTGIFFKLNHSHAALADFLKEKVMDPKSIKGYSMLSADEKSQLWKSKSKSKWKGKRWFIHFRKPLQVCLRPFFPFEGWKYRDVLAKAWRKNPAFAKWTWVVGSDVPCGPCYFDSSARLFNHGAFHQERNNSFSSHLFFPCTAPDEWICEQAAVLQWLLFSHFS